VIQQADEMEWHKEKAKDISEVVVDKQTG